MKKYQTFKNAYDIYHSGRIRKEAESEFKAYYVVTDCNSKKDHSVVVEFDPEYKVVSMECDCTFQALKIKHSPLCSHILATVQVCVYDLGKPKRS